MKLVKGIQRYKLLGVKYAKGYSDLETKTLLTGEEYFNIYSCSKITTVTAALQLLEKGKESSRL